MKKAVFIGSADSVRRVYSAETMEALRSELDFVCDGKVLAKDDLEANRAALSEVDYIFSTWGMPTLTVEEVKTYFSNAKAVFYAAGSVQQFARPFLDCGIAVFSAWAANGVPVAEYTLAQITLATKGFFQRLHVQANGNAWDNKYPKVDFKGNYEATVGIIGAGMIGKMVINKLHTALDRMKVYVFDPFLPQDVADELGVTLTDLDTIFSECDVISNHLANNPQTVGMLSGKYFDKMKPGCVFINTGRGAQVVEDDMIAALKADPTRAAVLDVTYPEPPAADSELYTLPNVYLTPHIAGSLGCEVHRMAEYMYDEYKLFDAGKETRYGVSYKMLETMA